MVSDIAWNEAQIRNFYEEKKFFSQKMMEANKIVATPKQAMLQGTLSGKRTKNLKENKKSGGNLIFSDFKIDSYEL